jgi:hypothetical protein
MTVPGRSFWRGSPLLFSHRLVADDVLAQHVLEELAVTPVLRVAVVGRSLPATSVTSTSRCTPMHSLPPGFTEVVLPMASWPFDAVEISAFR